MMLNEFALALALTTVLWLIGVPISVLLQKKFGEAGFPFAVPAALALAFGIALVALVSAPAFMAIGPSEIWAWPLLLVLLIAAAAAAVLLGSRWPAWSRDAAFSTSALALVLVAVGLCLAAPALSGGFNRVVFNVNPSDSLMYMTLSESTRTASLDQIRDFAQNPAALVSENPLALYSARFVGVLMRLTTFIDLGWFSHVSGLSIERTLWAFAFAMGIATASTAWGVARLIRIPNIIAALAAIAITVGFWGAMPREADAYSHLQSMPLMLALVALRVIDASRDKPTIALSAGTGLLLAALAQVYTELIILPVGVLVAEALVRALIRWNFANGLIPLGVSLATAFGALVITGQLGYLIEIATTQYTSLAATAAAGGFAFEQEAREDYITAIVGFPSLSAYIDRFTPTWFANYFVLALSWATILAAVAVGIRTLWKRDEHSFVIVAGMAAAGVAMALVALLMRDDVYVFQKAMTSAAPFSLLLAAAIANWPRATPLWRRVAAAGAGVVMAVQLIFPGVALARDLEGGRPIYTERFHQGRNYDLTALHRRLDDVCPCELLVNVSPEQDWWYAAYVALSLARYNPYYQMGYFFDNGPKTTLVPGIPRMAAPRYAVVHYKDDVIGRQRLGNLLYDEGQLRLYEVTEHESAAFAPRALPAPAPAAE